MYFMNISDTNYYTVMAPAAVHNNNRPDVIRRSDSECDTRDIHMGRKFIIFQRQKVYSRYIYIYIYFIYLSFFFFFFFGPPGYFFPYVSRICHWLISAGTSRTRGTAEGPKIEGQDIYHCGIVLSQSSGDNVYHVNHVQGVRQLNYVSV